VRRAVRAGLEEALANGRRRVLECGQRLIDATEVDAPLVEQPQATADRRQPLLRRLESGQRVTGIAVAAGPRDGGEQDLDLLAQRLERMHAMADAIGAVRRLHAPRERVQQRELEDAHPAVGVDQALDLHYLLTFHGDDAQAEPQRLLGGVVSALHTRAVLSREGLRRIVADAGDPDNPNPPHPYLASSDLAEQAALVRFTPLALNLEELSKLWSVFFQTRYVLSLAYQASVVLIEADEAARAALPVRRRGVTVVPFRRPLIDEVVPQIVEPGAVLTLRGRNLAAAAAVVVFDGATEVAPLALRDAELEVAVPATVPAGIRTVAVRHDVDLATPHEPHRGLASNLVAFALAPVITTPLPLEPVARGDVLRLDLRPSLEGTQAVRLLLGDRVIPIRRDATVPDRSGHAEFTIPHDVPAADGYLLRVEVDGVPSALQVDEDDDSPTVGQYVGPLVTIT
jgi:hypothetical protein